MKRDMLIIPLEELTRHFETNERQDIKIVAPSILIHELYETLIKKGKRLKPEVHLSGNRWERSYKTKANKICESSDFVFELPSETKGPFTISFANEKAEQEEHYHKYHAEIYFSEHRISGYYRKLSEDTEYPLELSNGGLVLFQPNVIHYIELSGLTLILETPALEIDRYVEGK
jgi:hypothetical protein